MKNYIYTIAALVLFSASALGQTDTKNYVQSTDYLVPTQTSNHNLAQKIQEISYYDGLGRMEQSIATKTGGAYQDIVTYSEYNEMGQQPKSYMPLVSNLSGNLDYITPANVKADILTYYNNEYGASNPYSETVYEQSPRMRPMEQGAPGDDWKIIAGSQNDHTINLEYGVNTSSDDIFRFEVVYSGGGLSNPSLTLNQGPLAGLQFFEAGSLTKLTTKDENWTSSSGSDHTVEEFQDKLGRTVLKRTFNNGIKHDTYYVYDDFGNMVYVLSPECSVKIINAATQTLIANHMVIVDKLGYQYSYDNRHRLIEKKIPGKGWEYIVYDLLDRPVLTQDALQRQTNTWLFSKYDGLGRVAYTGKVTSNNSRSWLQSNIWDTQANPYESRISTTTTIDGKGVYYTNSVSLTELNTITLLTINYYDDYNADSGNLSRPASVYAQLTLAAPKGMPTVSHVRVLDTSDWIVSLSAYDDRARLIYVASENPFLDTTDTQSMDLQEITGWLYESTTTHTKGSLPTITTVDYYNYDQIGRVLTHEQQIDNGPVQLIAENAYDGEGRLVLKNVGGETFVDGYTDITNCDVLSDGTMIRDGGTPGWNSGAKTRGEVITDGGIRYRPTLNTSKIRVGFVKTSGFGGAPGWDDFDVAIEHSIGVGLPGSSNKEVRVIKNGVLSGIVESFDQEEFSIVRTANVYSFQKDGVEFDNYTDTSPTQTAGLVGKASLHGENDEVAAVELFGTNIDKKLQNVDYSYNIRGWLTDINNIASTVELPGATDLFDLKINYTGTFGSNNPLYNGNISQTFWRSKHDDTQVRGYRYSYDTMNRITDADGYLGTFYGGGGFSLNSKHDLEDVAYDRNGNITGLKRRGDNSSGTTNQYWDDLSYTYDSNSNQLLRVTELSTDSLKDSGFKDGSNSGDDYNYDVNGNLTLDNNKGITSITYNHLNLPEIITFNGQGNVGTITYQYDATGQKLQKNYINTGSSSNVTTQYAGNYIYSDNETQGAQELEFFNHPEGYIEPVANTTKSVKGFTNGSVTYSSYNYVFQYRDHLGNVRLSYADGNLDGVVSASEVIEESNYYPFGLKQKGYNYNISPGGNSLAQQYKFGGKELNSELSLEWYDFGARNYDPALGRWMNIDPLAEYMWTHSPYNYAFNNPIYYIDPDGNMPFSSLSGPLELDLGFELGDGLGNDMDSNFSFISGGEQCPDGDCDTVNPDNPIQLDEVVITAKRKPETETNQDRGCDDCPPVWGLGSANRGNTLGTRKGDFDMTDVPTTMNPSGGMTLNKLMEALRAIIGLFSRAEKIKKIEFNESTMENRNDEPVDPPEETKTIKLEKVIPHFKRWNNETIYLVTITYYDTVVKKTASTDSLIRSKDSINKSKIDKARKKFNERNKNK